MKTDKTTIYDLFQTQRRYVVPLFQRGYVWNRERQWEPLWDDVVSQAAETVRHRTGHAKALQKHFLGAVVLNLTFTALKRVPVVEIIDGQQRLTTLQVLLAALRDETGHIHNEFMRADLHRLTRNQGPFYSEEERFKVWPTSAIQEHVQRVMELGSRDDVAAHYAQFHVYKYGAWRPPRPALVEAYLFFADRVRQFLDDDPEELPFELLDLTVEQRAEVLVEALIKNIQLVTIELEQEDDAQVIFETLNARGEPLTPSDLVRNFVFLTATRENLDVEALYDSLWKDFEEGPPHPPFWKVEERQGRLKRSRLDLFLFHYVWLRRREELKIGHLYQGFRDWWDSEPDRDIATELSELRRYSAVYRQLLAPDGKSRLDDFARRLRAIDTSTVYPVVLWAANAYGLASPQFGRVLKQIESFLIRRAVCGYNQKAYNRIFLELLKDLEKNGRDDPSLVERFLASSKADSAVWPSDDEFRGALIGSPLYRSFRPGPTLMLLQALEQALQHEYSEDITINSPLSVEHVLPQGGDLATWPLEVHPGEDVFDANARRTRLIHSLGNLTLVTQPLNSSVSNGPFVVYGEPKQGKRYEITSKSRLAMNFYFTDVPAWDEAAIERRSRSLADVAVRVWPGPGALWP